jgi:hypothetical protein
MVKSLISIPSVPNLLITSILYFGVNIPFIGLGVNIAFMQNYYYSQYWKRVPYLSQDESDSCNALC